MQAQERARPQSGEGVSTFLQRLGYTSNASRKEFLQLNKGKFTADGGLILGYAYRLPSGKNQKRRESRNTSLNEPLFGAAYRNVRVSSHELNGACIYLVSGHGGPDPGAIGKVGNRELHEDEYAYDIILRLGRALMQKDAKVHLIIQDEKDGIRDDSYLNNSNDETCLGNPIPLDQTARLQQRCDGINRLMYKDKEKYKRAIFIHVDSRGSKYQVDVFFYHAPGSRLGKRLAENIHKTFEKKYDTHQPNRGFKGTVSERNLYVLKKANPVAAFLELGNIQNERDRKRLIIPSNRQALADWICQGIVADFKSR
ncbi:MAG: N-acetylmuramoyl-L-alanine amidase [Paraprevotella sp.]|nr:N-acetylmuramoyl-L-alanine amidase [Paraprevotella sp.]